MKEQTASKTAPAPADRPGSRTIHELELVISGAVIFGLFQLPAMLDRAMLDTLRHTSEDMELFPIFLYTLAQFALVALIAVFLLHFLGRCLWVGAEGLSRAFPQGIDWQKVDFGPVAKRFYRDRHMGLPEFAGRLDRFCSSLFSALFLIIIGLLQATLIIALMSIATLLLHRALPGQPLITVFLAVYVAVFLPTLLLAGAVAFLDRRYRGREQELEARPRLKRRLERCLKLLYYMNFAFVHQPVMLTFRSRVSGPRFQVIMFTLTILMMAVAALSIPVRSGALRMESYVYFPEEPGALGVQPEYYENLRDPESSALVPTIPADQFDGPFLRLFLPFDVDEGNELMREACPELSPYRSDGFRFGSEEEDVDESRNQATLACLAQLYSIHLNGEELETELFFSRRESDRVPGLVSYLPAKHLVAGRNLLLIIRLDDPLSDELEERERYERYHIPFWYAPGS